MNRKAWADIMRIKFFEGEDGFMDEDAVKPGVYIVKLAKKSSKIEPINLYIGESYSMAQRCGRHLYETLVKNPKYFGLTPEMQKTKDLVLMFKVLKSFDKELIKAENRDDILKTAEKEYIREIKPITQYETCDRVLPEEKRMKAVEEKVEDLLGTGK